MYKRKLITGEAMLQDAVRSFPNSMEARKALASILIHMQTAEQNEVTSKVFGRWAHKQAREESNK